jgi:hypothetical protein
MIWIGIDAHKRVHQALALSVDGVLGHKTIANTAIGWTELLRWASAWPERIWAVEVRAHLDAEWPSSSPLVESGCTRSIRDGPLSVGVDYVDLARATCSMRRQ